MKEKGKQGFASMDPEKVKDIACMGGKKISQDKEWMKHIGQRGGFTTQLRKRQDQAYLAMTRLDNH